MTQSNEFNTVYRQQIKRQYVVYSVFRDISGYTFASKMTFYVSSITNVFNLYHFYFSLPCDMAEAVTISKICNNYNENIYFMDPPE